MAPDLDAARGSGAGAGATTTAASSGPARLVAIHELRPSLAPPATSAAAGTAVSVAGRITVTWPYNGLARTQAFVVAEADARRRRAGGLVKVRFAGPAADAVHATAAAGGDAVVLSLLGAEWLGEEERSGGTANGTGKSGWKGIDWELKFARRLRATFTLAETGEVRHVDVDAADAGDDEVNGTSAILDFAASPAATAAAAAAPSPPHDTPLRPAMHARTETEPEGTYSSPAFLKRARLSYGALFEDGIDVGDGAGIRGSKRLRFSLGGAGTPAKRAWKVISRDATPEPPTPGEEGTVLGTSPGLLPSSPAPANVRAATPMVDEASQTDIPIADFSTTPAGSPAKASQPLAAAPPSVTIPGLAPSSAATAGEFSQLLSPTDFLASSGNGLSFADAAHDAWKALPVGFAPFGQATGGVSAPPFTHGLAAQQTVNGSLGESASALGAEKAAEKPAQSVEVIPSDDEFTDEYVKTSPPPNRARPALSSSPPRHHDPVLVPVDHHQDRGWVVPPQPVPPVPPGHHAVTVAEHLIEPDLIDPALAGVSDLQQQRDEQGPKRAEDGLADVEGEEELIDEEALLEADLEAEQLAEVEFDGESISDEGGDELEKGEEGEEGSYDEDDEEEEESGVEGEGDYDIRNYEHIDPDDDEDVPEEERVYGRTLHRGEYYEKDAGDGEAESSYESESYDDEYDEEDVERRHPAPRPQPPAASPSHAQQQPRNAGPIFIDLLSDSEDEAPPPPAAPQTTRAQPPPPMPAPPPPAASAPVAVASGFAPANYRDAQDPIDPALASASRGPSPSYAAPLVDSDEELEEESAEGESEEEVYDEGDEDFDEGEYEDEEQDGDHIDDGEVEVAVEVKELRIELSSDAPGVEDAEGEPESPIIEFVPAGATKAGPVLGHSDEPDERPEAEVAQEIVRQDESLEDKAAEAAKTAADDAEDEVAEDLKVLGDAADAGPAQGLDSLPQEEVVAPGAVAADPDAMAEDEERLEEDAGFQLQDGDLPPDIIVTDAKRLAFDDVDVDMVDGDDLVESEFIELPLDQQDDVDMDRDQEVAAAAETTQPPLQETAVTSTENAPVAAELPLQIESFASAIVAEEVVEVAVPQPEDVMAVEVEEDAAEDAQKQAEEAQGAAVDVLFQTQEMPLFDAPYQEKEAADGLEQDEDIEVVGADKNIDLHGAEQASANAHEPTAQDNAGELVVDAIAEKVVVTSDSKEVITKTAESAEVTITTADSTPADPNLPETTGKQATEDDELDQISPDSTDDLASIEQQILSESQAAQLSSSQPPEIPPTSQPETDAPEPETNDNEADEETEASPAPAEPQAPKPPKSTTTRGKRGQKAKPTAPIAAEPIAEMKDDPSILLALSSIAKRRGAAAAARTADSFAESSSPAAAAAARHTRSRSKQMSPDDAQSFASAATPVEASFASSMATRASNDDGVLGEDVDDDEVDMSIALARNAIRSPSHAARKRRMSSKAAASAAAAAEDQELQQQKSAPTPAPRGKKARKSQKTTATTAEAGSSTPADAAAAAPPTADEADASETMAAAANELAAKLTETLHKTHAEYVPLAKIKNYAGHVPHLDVMAVVVADPPRPPTRTKAREYALSFAVTEPGAVSISPPSPNNTTPTPLPAVTEVHIFRPHKESLPVVSAGDAVLLRQLTPIALQDRGWGLRSAPDASAWAVLDAESIAEVGGEAALDEAAAACDSDDDDNNAAAAPATAPARALLAGLNPQARAGAVELSTNEARHLARLRRWYALLPPETRHSLAHAADRSLAAGAAAAGRAVADEVEKAGNAKIVG